MPNIRVWPATVLGGRTAFVPFLAGAVVLASCKGGDSSGGRPGQKGLLAAAMAARSSQDPCTLLTASEAEPYVGPLVSPPFRAVDGSGTPSTTGEECMYLGRSRQLTVLPRSGGGEMMGKVLTGVPGAMNKVLGTGQTAGMTTEVNRVMQKGPPGPWDNATWIPGGSLFVTRRNAQVVIDMSGATGQQSDALVLARKIMRRLGHPLNYNGAKAVALAPRPMVPPANACDLLPRQAVEAAIGPLSGTPVSDSASCTYRVATAQGQRSYTVGFTWQGGREAYNRLKHGMSMLSGVMGTPASSPMDTMKPNAGMQQAIGGLMKLMGGSAAKGAAPGAATKVGFQTDTTLKGPWDDASLLHGTQLIAVRHGVFVVIDLQSADYEQAKALMGAICTRL